MSTLVNAIGGRLGNGRFAAGNPGGPGNPNAAQTAKLRQALLSCITEDEVVVVFRALIERAKEGNIQAIKMVLLYIVGKPGAIGAPIGNGDNGEIEPIGNGVNGEAEAADDKEAPSVNGDNGHHQPADTKQVPLANGEDGQAKPNSVVLSAAPGQKLSGRALRKWKEAVKRAGLKLPRR